ncbi:zinc-binding alcohol dehydrogenase family protein [Marinilongibacter aquaticus]|uniref:zinc-binding alcohol dehydrogenase family protein n=1 Tax=Marinilongibacter aquaticus TaxID=2975157 RepID=UPI0021BD2AB4|nr:zinc-binding alcohol dehydrogenase family protein [Marinilongibacter aquaticus]UBM59195.1 zinc-binding alcohol dehydrogenase family protein [Marinilongibacter aquaticus]
MRALRLNEPGQFAWTELDKPELKSEGEVLVKIKAIGICGTDIHAYHGRQPFFSYPRILGHELGVEVIEIGKNVTGLQVGDRCAVEPYLNCGKCHSCKKGKSNCCENLQVLGVHTDGGMTEYMCLPADKLHKSNQLRVEELAVVETYGIGCHAVARADVQPSDKVLVIGAGPIGITAIDFAQIAGAEVHVMDINTDRLAFCQEHGKGKGFLQAAPDEHSYDVVFDATGHPESMKQALKYIAHGGKLVFIGLFQGDYSFHDPYFHKKETTLLSSRNALPSDFKRIIDLIEKGQLDLSPFISEEVDFKNAPAFFTEISHKKNLIKGVIRM